LGADIAAGRHDKVGLVAGVGAESWPDTDTLGAVLNGALHVEVL
jgi:hypothetical protein